VRLSTTPDPGHGGDAVPDRELSDALATLADSAAPRTERGRAAARLSAELGRRASGAGRAAYGRGRLLADLLLEVAPHIPVRDLATLAAHHDGLTGEALADSLERVAANATTGIGAAVGGLVAAQWVTAPMLVAVPLEVVVETVAVAAVEVKLIAELHAVYHVEVPGTGSQRAVAFVQAWSDRRGVDVWRPWTVASVVGAAARARLARRMIGRFGRNLGTLLPLFVGAAVGARTNRTETRRVSTLVRADLRARPRPVV